MTASANARRVRCADLLVVGPTADVLAGAVLERARARGAEAVSLPVSRAAEVLSMSVDADGPVVSPSLPIFLRSLEVTVDSQNEEARFSAAQSLAHLWAIAACCTRTVVNRPQPRSLIGRVPVALPALETAVYGSPRTTETFSSDTPTLDDGRSWCVQDLTTYRTAAWPLVPEGRGPYRARSMPTALRYVVAIGVAQQIWVRGPEKAGALDLEAETQRLIKGTGLSFAAVTWACDDRCEQVSAARVDAFPSQTQLGPLLPVVAAALCEELLG